jgi:polyisoprenoid-binding protein YceI
MEKTIWTLDPVHSETGFKIRHLMITNVSGSFKEVEAHVETDGFDFTTARIRADIKTASIDTGNLQRDEHLRQSDFFETALHPSIHFESAQIIKLDEDHFELKGQLTMKGITKPVSLQVTYSGLTKDPWGGERAGFTVTGKINRTDWGLNFNAALETGGVVLSDEVKIACEVQLIRQAATTVQAEETTAVILNV